MSWMEILAIYYGKPEWFSQAMFHEHFIYFWNYILNLYAITNVSIVGRDAGSDEAGGTRPPPPPQIFRPDFELH